MHLSNKTQAGFCNEARGNALLVSFPSSGTVHQNILPSHLLSVNQVKLLQEARKQGGTAKVICSDDALQATAHL